MEIGKDKVRTGGGGTMGRPKTNRYRIVTDGLRLESNVSVDFCKNASDERIIKAILIGHGFKRVCKSFTEGKREVKLVPLRIH